MKQKTRWHDALVLAAVLCAAFLIVTGTQQVTGRIDGVASMVFVLAVFLISIYTDGYVWGVVASLIGVLAVNFAFRSPYFAFNFTLPENLFSGMAMLVVSIMTSTLTTRIKKQEQLRMESETEKMRATLLREADAFFARRGARYEGKICARPLLPFTGPVPRSLKIMTAWKKSKN